MTGEGDAPKNEFVNFLDDIAEEISQRVESLSPPKRPAQPENQGFGGDRHVLDWPNIADRLIDELR
jgi:hypothetical protein